MLGLKKLYREELLQLALLLSLLRVDPESYLGIDIQRIGVGSLDLNNGSGWQTDSHTIAVHRPMYIHPKNPDSMLLNYERDLFEELNSLGRYNRMNLQQNNIHAYLLNVDDNGRDPAVAGSSIVDSTDLRRNVTSPDPPSDAQTSVASVETAELTQEDMDLIEVLWKQDVDLGFTLVDPEPPEQSSSKIEKESPDEIEKLKALQAVNATINENDTKNNVEKQKKEEKEEVKEEEEEDDPWAGLSYTVDLETGEYILIGSSSSGPGSGSGSGNCNNITENNNNINPNVVQDDQLLSTHLNLHEHQSSINENSLGLDDNFGLEDDFPSELLNGSLLCGTGVDGLLSNDSLGLPDGFNLEEALQLVGLNEVQPHEEIKSEEKQEKNCAKSLDTSGNLKDKITSSSCNKDNDIKNEIKHDKDDEDDDDNDEEDEDADDDDDDDDDNEMIHTPQFHHPHHRSFQGRMPFVRALSMEQPWQELQSLLGPDHFTHPPHPGYLNHGVSHHHHHHHYNNQRNVLLHNATLAPPIGDLNSTGPYHNVGGASNLGSAVATSMNLTNSSEPMGPDNSTAYKTEPNDMMFYHTPTSDTINQTSDGFFSSLLDDELHLVDMAMNEGMYTMRMLDNSSNNASGPTSAATSLPSVQIAGGTATNTPTIITNLPGVTDERMDASSDSAVSSMGSERVPSLSDGEWMETGSNSSHTQADSHYSMDYASKYRMPYECSYSVSGRNGGSPRCQNERMPPVAQKKHQMFAKRYFQEQGTCSPLSASAHPTTPVKYDYDVQTVGAGAPGNAYSGPIEGAAGIQSELKYSCSVDFSRHQTVPLLPGRTALEHVHHNHTYHLPPDTSGAMQRPLSRDKKARKHEADEHLTRDEKRARALNVPISVHDIINLPMDEFNERLSKYDLSEAQLSLIRDIRRRGKNKVAAQNCRKRKLDQIISLADQVKEMRDRKMRLIRERDFMLLERQRVKDKFSQLYRHVFQSLRDPDGNQYNPYEYSLQQSADGNILLVPRNQTNPHHSRQCSSTMESKNKPEPEHKE